MKMAEYYVPCLFGLEGLVADELRRMDIHNVRAENGHVRFSGEETDCAKANLRLRTGERVLLSLGSFEATSFDALFEGSKALPWSDYISKDGQFPVKGYCLNSTLHSVPNCQKIIKKAVSRSLGARYHMDWLPESGAMYQIQFAIVKDRAELFLDTTGVPLFKRGYRPAHVAAPLRETLAAGLVSLARYRGRDAFCDPMCGSGTIAIEAALAAHNRAPGLQRSFSAQKWRRADRSVWIQVAEEARALEYPGPYEIYASDIDPEAVELSRANAARAGVAEDIRFSVSDACNFIPPANAGVLVTNPPYGERLLDRDTARQLYQDLGPALLPPDKWKKFIICSDPEFEIFIGRTATKKRKLYNGMLLSWLYMYF